MPDIQTVVDFPGAGSAALQPTDFACWMSWVEGELSILGIDLSAIDHDWREAFEAGLEPYQAAELAAGSTKG